MKTFNSRKNKKIGPGGIKCPCCRPTPASVKVTRTILNRQERRSVKAALKSVKHLTDGYE